jgi:glyoxylase-like metal-dependent hydrolase (beta-lactamase superfamily II)
LIDNGIGTKQSEKFFSYYYLNGEHSLESSLHNAGVDFGDITDVILSHLHFDHCGGSVKWNNGRDAYELAFPNAQYWVHPQHWKHALDSNAREKPSFLKENMLPIQEYGNLKFLDDDLRISDNIDVIVSNGHTESMICPRIKTGDKTLVFVADLIPSSGHIKPNYVMGYDIYPLITMEERARFLKLAVEENYTLFFEHDLNLECGTVEYTDRGYRLKESFSLKEFI